MCTREMILKIIEADILAWMSLRISDMHVFISPPEPGGVSTARGR